MFVKAEVSVLGSPFLISRVVSVDIKQHRNKQADSPTELRGCVEVDLSVLGSPSLISLMLSVDVSKQH